MAKNRSTDVGSRAHRRSTVTMFLLISALTGVLVAGALAPAAGAVAILATSTASTAENLPAEFELPPQNEGSRVLLADGSTLARFYENNRTYVPLNKISTTMRDAQLAIEDHRYYEHGALDLRGTLRALVSNTGGGNVQGGSSITQQYVKMVQVQTAANMPANTPEEIAARNAAAKAARERTLTRKIQELRFAIALEERFSKDEILERYLNIAYYGDGAYGVQAAAKHYFNTDASKLDLAQSAMLAGLVQNPVRTDPVNNPEASITRRNTVLARMASLGIVSRDEADKAKDTAFNQKQVQPMENGCTMSRFPSLCWTVWQQLMRTPSLGDTREARANLVNRGGLTITTTIDPKAQATAEKSIHGMVSPKDPAIATMNVVEPGTGKVIVSAQSRDQLGNKNGESYLLDGLSQADGGTNGGQAGSTFKAFTMLAALEKGYGPGHRIFAAKQANVGGQRFTTCDGTARVPSSYAPKNVVGHDGKSIDMREAAAYSVNTYFVPLYLQVGGCSFKKAMEQTGLVPGKTVRVGDGSTIDSTVAATLGTPDVGTLDLANAYATFASRGKYCRPIWFESIKGPDDTSYEVPSADCKQTIKPKVADQMNSVLAGVMNGTGSRARIPGGYPQAGKTGTTNNNEATLFAGYTPTRAGAASIAVDKRAAYWKNRSMSLKNRRLPVSGTSLEGSGSGDAGRYIYKPTMTAALKGEPKTPFK